VPTVVYLDNASFHRSQDFRRCWERWLACGLRVRYLPCYSPHLNLMETVWRRVKGGLMPRRYYEDVASLRAAVVAGLKQLGGEELKI
jgi:putative transposase